MPANVIITDLEGKNITSIEYGRIIMGKDQLKVFTLKNLGDSKAYNVTIFFENTINASDKDKLATSWKSLSIDGETFKDIINVGTIQPKSSLEGKELLEIKFSTDNESVIERWNTGVTSYDNGNLIFTNNTGDGSGVSGRRLAMEYGNIRDFDIKFKLSNVIDNDYSSDSNLMCNFCLRMNSKRDAKGYMISVQRRRTDGKLYIAIYKDSLGFVSNNERDTGTRIFNTSFESYNDNDEINIKLYNDEEDRPCFEAYNNGKVMFFNSADKKEKDLLVAIDKNKTYTGEGRFYLDSALWKGDVSYKISDLSITKEIYNKPIYLKTNIDRNIANDKDIFTSYLTVKYEEIVEEEE